MKNTVRLMMGNEAIAIGAIRAGVAFATGYPGTPSSEILEALAREAPPGVYVEWSVNEKVAMEVAAGAAISGGRSIVTMKQVGLNVASDPLMSLNYIGVKAGLVAVVADDPGPISSQTEQDTRYFGQFAKIPVFDPCSPEEAYLMIEDAFAVSEKIGRPVILRPTTRVCHAYASVTLAPAPGRETLRADRTPGFSRDGGKWAIFPKLSYQNHIKIEESQRKLADDFASLKYNVHRESSDGVRLGLAAGGACWTYLRESLAELEALGGELGAAAANCALFKVGTVPLPEQMARGFLRGVDDVLVVEDLDPVIERELVYLCGGYGTKTRIRGKLTREAPVAGERLPADVLASVRAFLGGSKCDLSSASRQNAGTREEIAAINRELYSGSIPIKPPTLCAGCPHRSSLLAVKEAAKEAAIEAAIEAKKEAAEEAGKPNAANAVSGAFGANGVNGASGANGTFPQAVKKPVWCGDIGCYTLANAKSIDMLDTCLCMGADITMAQGIGRADPSVQCFSFIGDSTFFHSGITGLANAAYNGADIIVCVLDNGTTAMTGGQENPGSGKRISTGQNRTTNAPKMNIAAISSALGSDYVQSVDAFDFNACKDAVRRALSVSGVRVIVFEGACASRAPKKMSVTVDAAACSGCGSCVDSVGCPALTTVAGKASIDGSLCVGCGLCQNFCVFGAIIADDGGRTK